MESKREPQRRPGFRGRRLGAALLGVSSAALLLSLVARAGVVVPGFAAGIPVAPQRLTTADAAGPVSASTCTLTASADAYVDQLAPGTNAGSATDLAVRSELSANRRALVLFDVASCSIPSTASVDSAQLRLHLSSAPLLSQTLEARRATSSWAESTVTWAAQPSVAGSATATAATGTSAGATVSWTVTSDVQAFVNGSATNHGWRIADATEDLAVATEGVFGSRERAAAAERPSLVVTYYP